MNRPTRPIKKFRFISAAGVDFGVYAGTCEADAWYGRCRAAGYKNPASNTACIMDADMKVEEVQP